VCEMKVHATKVSHITHTRWNIGTGTDYIEKKKKKEKKKVYSNFNSL
jgi:hypothetical protein